jgi:hypothetical protein
MDCHLRESDLDSSGPAVSKFVATLPPGSCSPSRPLLTHSTCQRALSPFPTLPPYLLRTSLLVSPFRFINLFSPASVSVSSTALRFCSSPCISSPVCSHVSLSLTASHWLSCFSLSCISTVLSRSSSCCAMPFGPPRPSFRLRSVCKPPFVQGVMIRYIDCSYRQC